MGVGVTNGLGNGNNETLFYSECNYSFCFCPKEVGLL